MPEPALSRRALLGSLAAAALLPLPRPLWQAQAQSLPARPQLYGWDPKIEGPRQASYHVAPSGDDGAPGTEARPLRTISRGVELLARRGEGSLALHAGVYREAVDLSALRGKSAADGRPAYRLHRFGSDPVVITAANPLRGWTPCTGTEALQLGLPAQGVYVAKLPLSALAHGSIWALNLHENGVYRPPAGFRANRNRPTALSDTSSMRTAQFETRGDPAIITAVRDPALVGVNPALLQEARILVYRDPNSVANIVPESFDPATGTLHLPAKPALRLHKRGNVATMLYALQNVPLGLAQGDWYARRQGDQLEVYYWPVDPAQLEGGIEISLRDHCIDFGTASSVELFGLELIRAAGAHRGAGSCVRRGVGPNGAGGEDLRLIHCRAAENMSAEGPGYGAVFLRHALRPLLHHCTMEACRNNIGLAIDNSRDADLRHLEFRDISRSGARFFGLKGGILAFSRFENTGWDSHSNKFHFYLGSDRILVYGVRTQNTSGYVTYQQASRIHFAFCAFDAAPKSQGRALVSQNYEPGRGKIKDSADGSGDPMPGSTFWYWNLTLSPPVDAVKSANSLSLGPKNGTHQHRIHNSRLHGGGYGSIYTGTTPPEREVRSHNHYTGLSNWQSAKYKWALRSGETSGRRDAGFGRDMRADIQAHVAPLFPTFTDWDRDIDGQRIDWSAPPIGAGGS